jgi:CRP/FNR family transcriptional regulator
LTWIKGEAVFMVSDDMGDDTSLLGGLTAESLARITEGQATRALAKGEILFHERQQGSAVYTLDSGSVRLFRTDGDGHEAILHMVRPGELFAEAILFETERYPVSAQAREDSVVTEISAAHVHRLLADEPFRQDFLATLVRKVRFLGRQVYVLSSCDVRERLLRFLAERYGRRDSYRLELAKKEVAAAIATTPETLSRVVARLERTGMLQWDGPRLTLRRELWEEISLRDS